MILLLHFLMNFAHASPVLFFEDIENFKIKNLNIQTEQQNLKSSEDSLLAKRLFWTPNLNLSMQDSRTKLNSNTISKSNNIGTSLSWNLFRGGTDWSLMNEAKAKKEAQELQVLNEILKGEISASDLIFKSLYLIEIERIQKQFLKRKEESLKIVTDRYNQGKLPMQEVTKSEIDLTQQKNKVRSASLDLFENKSQINSLFVDSIKTSDWPFDEKVITHLPTDLKIPLIEQKYLLSLSQKKSWEANKGMHWPSLDMELQRIESPIKDRSDKQTVALITLSFPIWNRYDTSAKVSSAYAQYINSLNDYKNTTQALKQKNIFLKEKIEISRLNLIDSKNNLDISRKLYQEVLGIFRLGRISTNDLFLEQNRLLESENSLVLSQLIFHQSLMEVCALAGIKSQDCLY